jgi:hypothetical protein
MKRVSLFAGASCLGLVFQAWAADPAQSAVQSQTRSQTQSTVQTQERIYGADLMTAEERATYQNRMRSAKTEQEREAIRREHHEQMQARAKAQGKTLPDAPPADRGPGKGSGGGKGGRAY